LVDVPDRLCPHCRVCVGYLEQEEMTDERFLILSACIWLAPHVPKVIGLINGCAMLILVAAIGLGWIT
jgi:hypothetical protein